MYTKYMKVYNKQTHKFLETELVKALAGIRVKRKFDARSYLSQKAAMLNEYLSRFGLKSCVVAVSGGIDSAVTLGIVNHAKGLSGSPIQKIVAVSLPVFSKVGATNQEDTLKRGKDICDAYGLPLTIVDLTVSHDSIKSATDKAMGVVGEGWAAGQLVATTRTPTLYYITSLLTQIGLPGVICGTTNRDEGAYLGYFGKASDGMVDLQLISDIHKSEVYKLAEVLSVPESSVKAVPAGDMYDGRIDEEVFGTTYDFAELYLSYLALPNRANFDKRMASWSHSAQEQFRELGSRLESLHIYNGHKYLTGSPSIHFDIYKRGVPGGWTD